MSQPKVSHRYYEDRVAHGVAPARKLKEGLGTLGVRGHRQAQAQVTQLSPNGQQHADLTYAGLDKIFAAPLEPKVSLPDVLEPALRSQIRRRLVALGHDEGGG